MRIDLTTLYAAPNALAQHYRRFRVAERCRLTGHSHQAWPDRAERGLLRAFADAVAHGCEREGTALLLDTYHQLNVVPFSVRAQNLERAFVTGGGYKYCQLGEGNCFLRSPDDCALRPAITGWFAEFDALAGARTDRVSYGPLTTRFGCCASGRRHICATTSCAT